MENRAWKFGENRAALRTMPPGSKARASSVAMGWGVLASWLFAAAGPSSSRPAEPATRPGPLLCAIGDAFSGVAAV